MRTYTVLVNPISGGGKAPERVKPIVAALRAAGATVDDVRTEGAAHATATARGAADKGHIVVAAGGDGLVRDAADAVTRTGGILGIVPAGRGNDLARKLGVPADPQALAELLLYGEPRPIDVLQCDDGTAGGEAGGGGPIVPGNLYAGLDSVSNAMINSSRWIPAKLLYRLAPLRAILTWKPADYKITLDGVAIAVRAHTVVVANSGTYGHGLDIVPGAVVDDGLLDVLIAGDMPRWKIAARMREAGQGTHVRHPEMDVRTGREITIDADRPLPVCIDGDYHCNLPVTVRLRPAALRVLRP
ncbi:MAG: diacylglycerol/lipid kinase family protein [Micromonosporaceae bacterium]